MLYVLLLPIQEQLNVLVDVASLVMDLTVKISTNVQQGEMTVTSMSHASTLKEVFIAKKQAMMKEVPWWAKPATMAVTRVTSSRPVYQTTISSGMTAFVTRAFMGMEADSDPGLQVATTATSALS